MKTNELSMLLDDLITCGNKLIETAQALKDYYSSPDEEQPHEEPPKKEDSIGESKMYTSVEVRTALGAKAKIEDRKYKSEVKALVEKYSNDKTFTGIPEERYTELMKELEGIGNG